MVVNIKLFNLFLHKCYKNSVIINIIITVQNIVHSFPNICSFFHIIFVIGDCFLNYVKLVYKHFSKAFINISVSLAGLIEK